MLSKSFFLLRAAGFSRFFISLFIYFEVIHPFVSFVSLLLIKLDVLCESKLLLLVFFSFILACFFVWIGCHPKEWKLKWQQFNLPFSSWGNFHFSYEKRIRSKTLNRCRCTELILESCWQICQWKIACLINAILNTSRP